MQAQEYQRLFEAERRLWWFRAMHLFVGKLIPHHLKSQQLLALDIGCGTGQLTERLSTFEIKAVGLDYSATALGYARQRRHAGLLRADANNLPFKEVFDLIISVDVLELANIDPSQFATNALRALKPGGVGIFVMAAHQWLLSEHDRAVNSVRRYNLSQMKSLFSQPGVDIVRASYLFFLLFPLMVIRKLTNRARPARAETPTRSDVGLMPAIINEPLYWLCWLEAQVFAHFNLPLGSSALVMVRKHG